MDAKGGLTGKTEEDENPVMATGLYRGLPTHEVNDNYVDDSVMFPRRNIYARGKVIG